jgi:hypothetical protein
MHTKTSCTELINYIFEKYELYLYLSSGANASLYLFCSVADPDDFFRIWIRIFKSSGYYKALLVSELFGRFCFSFDAFQIR